MSRADDSREKVVDNTWTRYVQTLMYTHGIGTQTGLAQKLGVADSTPGTWFKRGILPKYEMAKLIAETFDKPLTEVMINAGLATPDQFGDTTGGTTVVALTNEELWMELGRRLRVVPAEAVDEPAPVEEKKPRSRKRGDAA